MRTKFSLKLLFSCLVLFTIRFACVAQQRIQLKYQPAQYQKAVAMTNAVGGGYILISNASFFGEADILITRLDDYFNVLWNKRVGVLGMQESASSFFQDADGNIYISGVRYQEEILLFKTDSSANLIWNSGYNFPQNTKKPLINGDAINGIFLMTNVQDGAGGDTLIVMRFDTSGVVAWSNSIGRLSPFYEIETENIVYSPNKFGVAIKTRSLNTQFFYLNYFDSSNNQTTGFYFGGDFDLNEIPQINDINYSNNHYCIAGNYFDSFNVYPTISVVNQGGNVNYSRVFDFQGKFIKCLTAAGGGYLALTQDFHLVKLDFALNIQWIKEYPSVNFNSVASLLNTNNGGFCIVGSDGNGILIVVTDSNGNTYCSDNNLTMGFVSGGNFTSISINWLGDSTAILPFTYSPVVTLVNPIQPDTICYYSGANEQEKNVPFSLFPNPANQTVEVMSDFKINTIEIYNLLGEKIYSLPIIKDQNSFRRNRIDVSSWPSSIYYFRVETQNGIAVEKLIKQ